MYDDVLVTTASMNFELRRPLNQKVTEYNRCLTAAFTAVVMREHSFVTAATKDPLPSVLRQSQAAYSSTSRTVDILLFKISRTCVHAELLHLR